MRGKAEGVWEAQGGWRGRKVVVTAERRKTGLREPVQNVGGLGYASDKLAERKQTIEAPVETDGVECAGQFGAAAVDIAHREITAERIAHKPRQGGCDWQAGVIQKRFPSPTGVMKSA